MVGIVFDIYNKLFLKPGKYIEVHCNYACIVTTETEPN